MKSSDKNSGEQKKQDLSGDSGEIVKKTQSQKSREEELADKSEGFGGSPEEQKGIPGKTQNPKR